MDNDIKIRILSSYEIIYKSFQLFFKNIRYILPICLAINIPYNILSAMINNILTPLIPQQALLTLDDAIKLFDGQNGIYIMRYGLVFLAITIIFTPLLAGGLSYVTVQAVEGKEIKVDGILDSSIMRWGKLVYTFALFSIILFLSMFFIIPVFYFGVTLMLSLCVVAISNKYGFSAILISQTLMRKRWLKGAGLLIFIGLTETAIRMMLTAIAGMMAIPNSIIAQFIFSLVLDFFGGFSYIAICLFYINLHYNYNNRMKEIIENHMDRQ